MLVAGDQGSRGAAAAELGTRNGQKVHLMFNEGHRSSFLVESYRSVGATPKSERGAEKQRRRKSDRIDQVYLNEDPTSTISGKKQASLSLSRKDASWLNHKSTGQLVLR